MEAVIILVCLIGVILAVQESLKQKEDARKARELSARKKELAADAQRARDSHKKFPD